MFAQSVYATISIINISTYPLRRYQTVKYFDEVNFTKRFICHGPYNSWWILASSKSRFPLRTDVSSSPLEAIFSVRTARELVRIFTSQPQYCDKRYTEDEKSVYSGSSGPRPNKPERRSQLHFNTADAARECLRYR